MPVKCYLEIDLKKKRNLPNLVINSISYYFFVLFFI